VVLIGIVRKQQYGCHHHVKDEDKPLAVAYKEI
jgi:hypothetical protein